MLFLNLRNVVKFYDFFFSLSYMNMLLCICTTSIHMDRILILGGRRGGKIKERRWQEAEGGGRRGIKEQTFLWKLKEDEEEGKSPSNTPTSSASKSPSTEAGWNETPYAKPGSNCTAGTVRTCLHVIWISFLSLVFGEKFWDIDCGYILHCLVLATRPNVSVGLFHKRRHSIGRLQNQGRRMWNLKYFMCAYLMRKQTS